MPPKKSGNNEASARQERIADNKVHCPGCPICDRLGLDGWISKNDQAAHKKARREADAAEILVDVAIGPSTSHKHERDPTPAPSTASPSKSTFSAAAAENQPNFFNDLEYGGGGENEEVEDDELLVEELLRQALEDKEEEEEFEKRELDDYGLGGGEGAEVEEREEDEAEKDDPILSEAEAYDLEFLQRQVDERDHLGAPGLEEMLAEIGDSQLTEDNIEALKALYFKVHGKLSRQSFDLFRNLYSNLNLPSDYHLLKNLRELSRVPIEEYACCINTDCAFTGPRTNLEKCPVCGHDQLDSKGKPFSTFLHIPLDHLLRLKHQDPDYAKMCKHRQEENGGYEPRDDIEDVFDGSRFQKLRGEFVDVLGEEQPHRYFESEGDVAVGIMTDGYQMFKTKKNKDCWPVIAINYSLPPSERYKSVNVLPLIIIPGPHKPKNFDTFFFPFVKLSQVSARFGYEIYDSYLRRTMQQHFFVLLANGDMPAMAMWLRMKGHNGKCPCRTCRITGILAANKKLYFPVQPPRDQPNWPTFEPLDLPLRTHQQFLEDAKKVAASSNFAIASRDTGINGLPLLAKIPGFDLIESCPVDCMHSVLENIMKNLILLWSGKFKGLKGAFVISEEIWLQIDREFLAAGDLFPSSYGRRPPEPFAHLTWFTAEDFSNFLLYFGPVALIGRLKKPYYDHFLKLRSIYKRFIAFKIPRKSVGEGGELREDCASWYEEYEKLYYQRKSTHLSAVPVVFHSILHACDYIGWTGPLHMTWSFVMERFCQTLLNLVRSRLSPYRSLINAVVIRERLKICAALYPAFANAISPPPSTGGRLSNSSIPEAILFAPTSEVNLKAPSSKQLRKLLTDYLTVAGITAYDSPTQIRSHFPETIISWSQIVFDEGRDLVDVASETLLRAIKDKHRRDSTWCSYVVSVDEHAGNRKKKAKMVDVVEYGILNGLYEVEYDKEVYLLAVIRQAKTSTVGEGENEVVRHKDMGAEAFVDVRTIQGSVGRWKHADGYTYFEDRSDSGARPVFNNDD